MDSNPGYSGQMDEEELTQKFLRGEITFAEYSNEWYGKDDEDLDDKADDDEPCPIPAQLKEKFNSKRRSKYTRLSTALLGLMGEANIRFVRGEKEIAEKMCYEIIRQVPNAPEPYQTLAQIYEGDAEKHLQFSLLAAHLSPSDAHEWQRLAAISKEKNDAKQEMLCYSQAVKAEPQNIDLHMKRLELLTALENINYPLNTLKVTRVKCYHKIVTSLPPSEGETIMKYAKLAASLYHSGNEIERALEVMAAAYKKCSSLFTLEDTNLFLELLIARRQYQTCIEVFVANAEVEIEAEIQTLRDDNNIVEQTSYLNCRIPTNLPIDLKSKLLVCFIYLKAFNLVRTLLDDFLTNDVEKAGDLYMDIEEALSAVGNHELAFRVLEPLVKNQSFDLGAVWLKHAECLYQLGREDDAVNSYFNVLKHAPHHADARQKLFNILERKNCIDDALRILNQDYKLTVSAGLLHQQCLILKKYNRTLEYLDVGVMLLYKTFVKFRRPEEFKFARYSRSPLELIHNYRISRGEKPFNDDIHFDEQETFKLSPQEEWELFKELLSIARKYGKYHVMEKLSFGALMSKSLAPHQQEIEFLCFQACLLNQDYSNALILVKDFAQKYANIVCWNMLNLISNLSDDHIQSKYLTRLFNKKPHIIKNLLIGYTYLTSGRYLMAMKYFLEYNEHRKDALSALTVAVTFLNMVSVRTIDKHHNLVLQAMAYLLKYQQLRKCDQETFYNLGRAFHMLSLNNLAIEYYEKVLACEPLPACKQHGVMNLTREAAYNLCVLYKDHSPKVAQSIMLKYLVI
ncbi:general transcription factor 3C polypeptide 3 [Plutella xylostella]|uniref:general transcription factor 3C polypeptide 3 n=1 Tax=Plutella xylostella TaxID=51655 RepID=UPI0020327426|nr:general transcription factor 3C polypeptide 3 [Plutella xylostella]